MLTAASAVKTRAGQAAALSAAIVESSFFLSKHQSAQLRGSDSLFSSLRSDSPHYLMAVCVNTEEKTLACLFLIG